MSINSVVVSNNIIVEGVIKLYFSPETLSESGEIPKSIGGVRYV